MSEPLRWGILGTGQIARKFATQLGQTQRGLLAAVGSRTFESAQGFAREFGGAVHATYDALLDDKEVEAVYVSLPNSLHAKWSIKAMEAGKHVLCEKPMASNVAEAQRMFDVARQRKRLLVEAFMYRAHPAIAELIRSVRAGLIGDVKLIRSHFTFNREDTDDDARYKPGMAGGSLMDVGCYCINLARALAGSEPTAMHAVAHRHATGVDDYAAGCLDFNGQTLATFTCGMTVEADRTTYVGGSTGYIEIDTPWFCNGRYTIVTENGDVRRTVRLENSKGLYALEAEAFADAVDGAEPWISPDDTLGNMRVLDALREQLGFTI